jgi:hypothetical protein
MTRYWVVGLIVAVVGLLLIVRRIARRPEADDEHDTLMPPGDAEREQARLAPHRHARRAGHPEAYADDDPDDRGDLDDTAPSVLSPPEWTPPKSALGGKRR